MIYVPGKMLNSSMGMKIRKLEKSPFVIQNLGDACRVSETHVLCIIMLSGYVDDSMQLKKMEV